MTVSDAELVRPFASVSTARRRVLALGAALRGPVRRVEARRFPWPWSRSSWRRRRRSTERTAAVELPATTRRSTPVTQTPVAGASHETAGPDTTVSVDALERRVRHDVVADRVDVLRLLVVAGLDDRLDLPGRELRRGGRQREDGEAGAPGRTRPRRRWRSCSRSRARADRRRSRRRACGRRASGGRRRRCVVSSWTAGGVTSLTQERRRYWPA